MWPDRKVIRLREYNYQQTCGYVVTICTHQRRCVFGRIENDVMRLNRFGHIGQEQWLAIPSHRPYVHLDEVIIMPNHLHGILFIEREKALPDETSTRHFNKPQSASLGTIIGGYKSGVTRLIGEARGQHTRVWQSGFYEHIIRHDSDLGHQREYIAGNPSKWLEDELNPQ